MLAKSVAQRRAMAIAEHHPSALYARNRGLRKMSKGQLHDFAKTKEGALPQKVARSAKGSGPFSLGQLGRGYKAPSLTGLAGLSRSAAPRLPSLPVMAGGLRGGPGIAPRLNTPGLTGRLRPRAALSNPANVAGAMGRSMRGSGKMGHADLTRGYHPMGKC